MSEEHKKEYHPKKDNLTISKLTIWKSVSVILGLLLLISIFTSGFSRGSNTKGGTADQPTQAAPPAQPRAAAPQEIKIEGSSFKGAESAKVIMIEYSSFSCGFCNRVRGTIDQILETYPDDVKLVYKHFNRGGTDSQTGQAAECAGDQDKFWEMHDMIFDKGSSGNLENYAKDIRLDVASFNECIESEKYASKVQQDTSEGRSLGVSGTPSFSINGKLVVGAQPFESFKQVIDAELAK